MEQIEHAIRGMIGISDSEMETFLGMCHPQTYTKKAFLNPSGQVPDKIFFVNKGTVRVFIVDREGREHTVFFALENLFIADYASFIQEIPSHQYLQAVEETEVVVMPRAAIEWGYANLKEGEKMGRKVAEFYFIYQDNRLRDRYTLSPKERYEQVTDFFPNLHNRVPQHMIASYLGITPVHLSRLKKPGQQDS